MFSIEDILSFAFILATVIFAFVKKVKDQKKEIEESQNKVGGWSEMFSSVGLAEKASECNAQPVLPTIAQEQSQSSPEPTTRPQPYGSNEGERVTKVKKVSVNVPISLPVQNDKDLGVNLHNKDTLRKVIILSDILPPKF